MSYYYRSRSHSNAPLGFYLIALIVLIIICVGRPINKVQNMRNVTVTVTDKAVKNKSDDGKYLVFGKYENGEVCTLEITDSLLMLRFDSSDVYAGIEVGNTYVFKVGGSRNKLFSWYPNIYEYSLVEEGAD